MYLWLKERQNTELWLSSDQKTHIWVFKETDASVPARLALEEANRKVRKPRGGQNLMHFYTIHVIAEFNLSGSEIICRQIFTIRKSSTKCNLAKGYTGAWYDMDCSICLCSACNMNTQSVQHLIHKSEIIYKTESGWDLEEIASCALLVSHTVSADVQHEWIKGWTSYS